MLMLPNILLYPGEVVTEEDAPLLTCQLKSYVYKWEEIGAALGFLPDELENIKHSHTTLEERLEEILHSWSQWPNRYHHLKPTREKLNAALRHVELSNAISSNETSTRLQSARDSSKILGCIIITACCLYPFVVFILSYNLGHALFLKLGLATGPVSLLLFLCSITTCSIWFLCVVFFLYNPCTV
jgi:hypothetical protein